MPLLRTNAKLVKTSGNAPAYRITGLTLAPHGLSGHQVCAGRSTGCAAACNLWFAGQRVTPKREIVRLSILALFADRETLRCPAKSGHRQLCPLGRSRQLTPLIRLNVASDLEWFDVIDRWPDVQFYDYTKIRSRFARYLSGKLVRSRVAGVRHCPRCRIGKDRPPVRNDRRRLDRSIAQSV